MSNGAWIGDVNGIRVRIDCLDDRGDLVMVSRRSVDTEEFVESRVCVRPEIGRVIEEMRKSLCEFQLRLRSLNVQQAGEFYAPSRKKA
jgi:hypothetical protein